MRMTARWGARGPRRSETWTFASHRQVFGGHPEVRFRGAGQLRRLRLYGVRSRLVRLEMLLRLRRASVLFQRQPHHASEALRERFWIDRQFSVEDSRLVVKQMRGILRQRTICLSQR